MDWLDRLRVIKADSNMTTREIADKSKIPEPTLEKIYSLPIETDIHCVARSSRHYKLFTQVIPKYFSCVFALYYGIMGFFLCQYASFSTLFFLDSKST